MRLDTLPHWAKRGWILDPEICNSPGEIINTGGGPYYIGEEPEPGYNGHSHPLIVTRYLIGTKIGRPLNRNELVRFRTNNRKDFRYANLQLHSKTASAAELYHANGDPILGYSHCLCGCGLDLDIARQSKTPYAFIEGHRPKSKTDPKLEKDKKRNQGKAKRSHKKKPTLQKIREDLAKIGQPMLDMKDKKEMPVTPLLEDTVEMPKDIQPLRERIQDEALMEFRGLFEKMITNLTWDEFKPFLTMLLEIHTQKGRAS